VLWGGRVASHGQDTIHIALFVNDLAVFISIALLFQVDGLMADRACDCEFRSCPGSGCSFKPNLEQIAFLVNRVTVFVCFSGLQRDGLITKGAFKKNCLW
jgi:hypothetical protein